MPPKAIDAAAVRALIETNPDTLLVDVRTPAEYESSHIDGAINLPLGQVDRHLERITQDAGGQMVLICQSGSRAEQCQGKLTKAGLEETVVMSGGMNAWTAAGAPVIRGPERWALERQVRLVAGSIVLLSVIAGLWWPPAVWVAGFIGAGLTFAAITNTCAMGMALTKLPYNQPRNKVDVEASLARISRNANQR
ncbi:MAG: rhodanese-like domain-containing protein [Nocardiopsis sp. BM-2018]|uniref:Rhodanese-like domain-containing protein n=1 Tax=Nocardiopsis tropica TaxID=109330 RepID=A0ABU7KMV3_9ACTN|nr:rhodanese-like domain-containing protein [Nocardiopsis umidischolae]MEE2050618.1 rhodanese-like domain-containing protein [Nocardiopsis umidischolae]QRN79632.1 MAG: rhodanese-like domain-containing protein [Nocardiopsis sp. BM-2018]